MCAPRVFVKALRHCLLTIGQVLFDLAVLIALALRSRTELAAENLFLRKQLALFQERQVRPRRAKDSTRWVMATLSRLFAWRNALVNVKPDTLLRWHRKGFRLFWRWKSRPAARPRLPKDLRELIRRMAVENQTWGEERIANELKLKLGISVSPRTVGKYLHNVRPRRDPDPQQRWLTFLRNHADVLVACDFFTVVTVTFRALYVFVILELGSRCSATIRSPGSALTPNIAAYSASQRHQAPDGGVDPPAVSRGAPRCPSISIRDPRPG